LLEIPRVGVSNYPALISEDRRKRRGNGANAAGVILAWRRELQDARRNDKRREEASVIYTGVRGVRGVPYDRCKKEADGGELRKKLENPFRRRAREGGKTLRGTTFMAETTALVFQQPTIKGGSLSSRGEELAE